jgi:hypothetical protein
MERMEDDILPKYILNYKPIGTGRATKEWNNSWAGTGMTACSLKSIMIERIIHFKPPCAGW